MKILLQEKGTGLYLKEIGGWTQDSAEAMDFLSSATAIDFCVSHQVSGVQLVLKFEEQHYDIVLPMAAARAQPAGSRGTC